MLPKFLNLGPAAAAPFITCSAASEWKDHFPLAFKHSIVREFNSQATDELGAPQGPSIHLALSCFVQPTLNRWAFVLTPLTSVDPPSPLWASSSAVTMCSRELIQPYLRYLCFMSGFTSGLHLLRAKRWKTPWLNLFCRGLQPIYIFVSCVETECITVTVHWVFFFSITTIHVHRDGRAQWKYLMFIKILGFFSSGQFVNHLALWGGLDHVS